MVNEVLIGFYSVNMHTKILLLCWSVLMFNVRHVFLSCKELQNIQNSILCPPGLVRERGGQQRDGIVLRIAAIFTIGR